MNAFGRAWKRYLAGHAGAWCIFGPFAIIYGWQRGLTDDFLVLFILGIALSYGFVV